MTIKNFFSGFCDTTSFLPLDDSRKKIYFIQEDGVEFDPLKKIFEDEESKRSLLLLGKGALIKAGAAEIIPLAGISLARSDGSAESKKHHSICELPVSDEECLAMSIAFQNSSVFFLGVYAQEKEEIVRSMSVRLIQAKNFLMAKLDSTEGEKPQVVKVSGKTSPYLRLVSSVARKTLAVSVSLYDTGHVVYSFGRGFVLEGGVKKVTFKLLSGLESPQMFETIAKLTVGIIEGFRSTPRKIANFLRGVRICEELCHPNIASPLWKLERRSVAFSLVGGSLPVIYMKALPPLDFILQKLKLKSAKRNLAKNIEIVFDLLGLLEVITATCAYISQKGYLHNDLKTDNILVAINQEAGRTTYSPIITDFDFACTKEEADRGDFRNSGSPGFFLPGQYRSDCSDIYALGKVFAEVIDDFLKAIRICDFATKEETLARFLGCVAKFDSLKQKMTKTTVEESPATASEIVPPGSIRYANEEMTYPLILEHLALIKAELRKTFGFSNEKKGEGASGGAAGGAGAK